MIPASPPACFSASWLSVVAQNPPNCRPLPSSSANHPVCTDTSHFARRALSSSVQPADIPASAMAMWNCVVPSGSASSILRSGAKPRATWYWPIRRTCSQRISRSPEGKSSSKNSCTAPASLASCSTSLWNKPSTRSRSSTSAFLGACHSAKRCTVRWTSSAGGRSPRRFAATSARMPTLRSPLSSAGFKNSSLGRCASAVIAA